MNEVAAAPRLIDREAERELFGRLIELEGEARVLTLADRGGQGKSSLLSVLRHNCLGRPTPVSLVALNELHEHTPLAFVKRIRRDLRQARIEFPEFDGLDGERMRGTPPEEATDAIREAVAGAVPASMHGVIESGTAEHSELTAAQLNVNVTTGDRDSRWLSNEERDDLALRSIEAFFQQLSMHCRERLAVIMVDAYEHCGSELRDWLLTYFLNWYCFDLDQRPSRLAVVVSGREVPDCLSFLGEERYERLVVPIPSLSQLDDQHVRELFLERGVAPTHDEVRFLRDKLRENMTIKQALQIVDALGESREDAGV